MTNKTVNAFNSFFYEFVKVAKNITKTESVDLYKTIKDRYTVKDYVTLEHIDFYASNVTDEFVQKLVNEDEIPGEIEIMKDIPLCKLTNETSSKSILSYVLIFTVLVMIHRKNMDTEQVSSFISILGSCQEGKEVDMEDIIDEDVIVILNKIKNLAEESCKESCKNANSFEDAIENSTIGSLAKEIAKDIDIDSLKIEKPEDMFSSENSKFIGDIVGKVTSSLHQKMQNGSLKQDQIMSEAMNLFSSMNSSGKNDMFGEMMKNMAKSFGGGNHNSSVARSRLAKKLAQRKSESK
jgi:hypothetical protein